MKAMWKHVLWRNDVIFMSEFWNNQLEQACCSQLGEFGVSRLEVEQLLVMTQFPRAGRCRDVCIDPMQWENRCVNSC